MRLDEIINTHRQSLNDTDMVIWKYILQHREVARHISIHELAKACCVSSTTIVRFAQKLGDLRLLDAAAQVWVDEARRYLALLASIPGNDIPVSKIPMHERVDLDAHIVEHRSTMASVRDAHV